jgi:hypothetical protein
VGVADDLDLLERQIRQLQIEWDKFFGGVERKPPNDLKAQVDALVRRYAYAEMRNNTERFRYQTLSSRYSSLSELWNKRLRAMEEGRPLGVHGARAQAAALPPPAAPLPPAGRPVPPPAASPRAPSAEPEAAVRDLYERFLAARREAGESAPVKYESFQKLIQDQSARIMADKGAQAVDFRLETKDGKVSIKARPVKRGSDS